MHNTTYTHHINELQLSHINNNTLLFTIHYPLSNTLLLSTTIGMKPNAPSTCYINTQINIITKYAKTTTLWTVNSLIICKCRKYLLLIMDCVINNKLRQPKDWYVL